MRLTAYMHLVFSLHTIGTMHRVREGSVSGPILHLGKVATVGQENA